MVFLNSALPATMFERWALPFALCGLWCGLVMPMLISRAEAEGVVPAHHRPEGGYRNLRQHDADPGALNVAGSDSRRRLWDGTKVWWRERKNFASWEGQEQLLPRHDVDTAALATPGMAPQVTWLGHSTVLVQYRGVNLLTDPMFSERCSPVPFLGPKRTAPPPLSLEELPPPHFVLISHDHYDHLDVATVRALGDQPLWLVPLGISEWLRKAGISADRIVELDWWQESRHRQGIAQVVATATPAQHWGGRMLMDRNQRLWSSWHVRIDDFTLWFGGDTGYDASLFQTIGRRLASPDLALIPIGAYLPRQFMRAMHVDPADAVKIFQDVGASRAIGIHWGTFQLSAEPIDAPPRDLAAASMAAELPVDAFRTLALGETWLLPLPPGVN